MRIFFDSSALVKRHVWESGTEEVLELCRETDEVILSAITSIEIVSALTRKKHEKKLMHGNYKKILQAFAEDIKCSTIIEVNSTVITLAIKCLQNFKTRSLDAIQIASAVAVKPVLFVTADKQQALAARGMKLDARVIG